MGGITNIQWYYSYNGFVWSLAGAGPNYNHYLPSIIYGENLFIKAVYSTSMGNSTAYIEVEIDRNIPCLALKRDISTENTEKTTLKLYPNPAKENITLELFALTNKSYNGQRLVITDFAGKEVFATSLVFPFPGYVQQHIDISGFRKGMYLLTIGSESVTFIKN